MGGGGISISVGNMNVRNDQDIVKISERLGRMIDDRMRRTGRDLT